jgi:sodium-dependent dicarboxylate transporter 2/3/5
LPLALLAGLVGGLLAPENWSEGPGTMSLEYRGEQIVEAPILVGEIDPVRLSGESGPIRADVTYPSGIPVDEPIGAWIVVTQEGSIIQPDIADVQLRITLGDGREELIPVIRWNDQEQRLEAQRRPTHDSGLVLGLLGFVVVMWVTEALPLFVTSLLIPVVLVFAGVATAGEATAPFVHPIIVLFFAGFLMAEAMRRTKLDHYTSVVITARAGHSPVVLFASMLGLAAFMSMWMSNTAAIAVLVPIALAVTTPLDHAGFQRALVLGIAYAGTIGGVGSAIGTPANQIAIEFLDSFGGHTISFVEWFAFGLPMVILFLPVMGWYLWKRSSVDIDAMQFGEVRAVAEAERRRVGAPSRDQIVVLGVFVAVAIGWVTQTLHGFHPGVVALAGAIALFVVGALVPEDLGRISWSSLITFGGGLTLGLFLVETGTSDFVATQLTGLVGVSTVIAIFAVALLTLLLTTFASNTASAAILIPLAIPLAGVLGISVTGLVVVVAMASSIDFALVVGTPPTMIAYSTRLYSASQIFRTGIVLDLVGVTILVFVVHKIWDLFGLI